MRTFDLIEGAEVLLKSRDGSYAIRPVYHRDGYLYAAMGTGFVRLCGHGATTSPRLRWVELEGPALFNIEPTNSRSPGLVT